MVTGYPVGTLSVPDIQWIQIVGALHAFYLSGKLIDVFISSPVQTWNADERRGSSLEKELDIIPTDIV